MGSTPHLSGELLKTMTRTEMTHVPYRGTGPAMNDLVGGHIQMFFDLLPGSLPQISGGKVRALANAGAKRPAALPDLPTVAEQGLPGFDAASWVALVAPAKTPAAVLAKLREEVGKAIASPDIVTRIRELGSDRARSPRKTCARSSMPRPRNGPRSSACPAPRRIDLSPPTSSFHALAIRSAAQGTAGARLPRLAWSHADHPEKVDHGLVDLRRSDLLIAHRQAKAHDAWVASRHAMSASSTL